MFQYHYYISYFTDVYLLMILSITSICTNINYIMSLNIIMYNILLHDVVTDHNVTAQS